ncbi:hypothetical protein AVEN_235270-1 [Araneus ventricosus]|uniref:Uncharacterized protein n=1 Tax=Araneus ventricosus TaxID=182803 RepID=A0A4Y2A343_ARAVE|nr:hypothetical protein AVEN_235270-1 [Araneus ventricosus]
MFAKLKTNPQTPQESNPITQYFEIGKQVASAGPELVWKIHEAVRKSDKRSPVNSPLTDVLLIPISITEKSSPD